MNHLTLKSFALTALFVLFSTNTLANDIWIDVRSAFEHKLDSIEGDIRISHDDIIKQVTQLYPDKQTKIYLYCRSGNRANQARQVLNSVGYQYVINAGSIGDARKMRTKIQSKK